MRTHRLEAPQRLTLIHRLPEPVRKRHLESDDSDDHGDGKDRGAAHEPLYGVRHPSRRGSGEYLYRRNRINTP